MKASRFVFLLALINCGDSRTLGAVCKDDSDCHASDSPKFEDFRCLYQSTPTGQCSQHCMSDKECQDAWGEDSVCKVRCQRTCESDSDCPDSTVCHPEGWCDRACKTDDDCAPNTKCTADKVCIDPDL